MEIASATPSAFELRELTRGQSLYPLSPRARYSLHSRRHGASLHNSPCAFAFQTCYLGIHGFPKVFRMRASEGFLERRQIGILVGFCFECKGALEQSGMVVFLGDSDGIEAEGLGVHHVGTVRTDG